MTNTICSGSNSSSNDKLFFSLWRNIVIRNVIINALNEVNFVKGDHKLGYFKYDQIIQTTWMVENGHLELLKTKVKNGHYLSFTNTNEKDFKYRKIESKYEYTQIEYKHGIDKLSIFNKDKNGLLDFEFYLNLFNNYSNSFNISNYNLIFSVILEYDNEIALKSLINKFGNTIKEQQEEQEQEQKPEIIIFYKESFYKCIEIGSFKCAFEIFKLIKLNKSNLILIWEIIIKNNYYRSLMIDKRVEFILGECKLPIINLICDGSIYDYLIHNQKLNVLVNSIKTILSIKELLNEFIDSINYNNSFKLNINGFKETEINQLLVKEKIIQSFNQYQIDLPNIQNIIKFPFTDKQLNMVIHEFKSIDKNCSSGDDDNDQQQIDIIVYEIVKFIIPFTNHYTHVKENFHYFNAKYNNSYHSLFHPILFGHYDWNDIKLNGLTVGKKSIFHYCKNEKQKQVNYINNLINDCSSSSTSSSENIQKLKTNVFIYLVEHNDIELLSHYYNQFQSLSSPTFNFKETSSSIGRIYKNIKSIEIFDFIQLIKSKILITSSSSGSSGSISGSTLLLKSLISNDVPHLLNHFKDKYKIQYQNEISNIKQTEILNDCSVVSINTFKFIYRNILDFISIYQCISFWESTPYFEILNPSFQDYIELINLTPSNKQITFPRIKSLYDNGDNYSDNNKLFNYIVNNQSISNKCICYSSQDKHAFEYFKNLKSNFIGLPLPPLQQIIIRNASIFFKLINLQIGYYGNIEFIDSFYNNVFIKENEGEKENFISCVFKSACEYGRINVYKHLELNYYNLIKSLLSKSITKDNNFSLHLLSVIKSGSIELFSLILNSFFNINQPMVIPKNVEILTFNNHLLINHFKSILKINNN